MKKIVIIYILSSLFTSLYAQTDYHNMTKYWTYKNILMDRHVINANVPGGGIPFDLVRKAGEANYQYDFGDGVVRLGKYISILATEYALLSSNNQPTDATKEQLYYALAAYFRLEGVIQQTFNSPNWHGFFVRDDAPSNLPQLYPRHVLYYNNGTFSNYVLPIRISMADAANNQGWEFEPWIMDGDNLTVSVDQVGELFMGLCFVVQYVPSGVQWNGVDLRQKAIEIADNIKSNLTYGNWTARSPARTTFHYDATDILHWVPRANCGGPADEIPCAAEFMNLSAWPLANAYLKIHPNNLDLFFVPYMDTWFNGDNGLHAISATILNPDGNSFYIGSFLREWSMSNQETTLDEVQMSLDYGAYVYPLINNLLYNKTTPTSKENILKTSLVNALNSAPCQGIHNWQGANELLPAGWRAGGQGRWDLSGSNKINTLNWHGEMTGMDYLLGYNLYHLYYTPNRKYYNTTLPASQLANTLTSFNEQRPFGPFAGINNDIVWADNLTSTSNIKANYSTPLGDVINGVLDLRGISSVTLMPGFSSEAGTTFSASIDIDGLNCNPNTSILSRIASIEDTQIKTDNETNFASTFSIYPNPATEQITFAFSLKQAGSVSWEIYNMNGQKVQVSRENQNYQEGNSEIEVDISTLPKAMYICRFTDSEGNIQTAKFVKE